MSVNHGPAQRPGHSPVSTRLLVWLVVAFIAAGFGTLLLTGQNHHAEARIACERFVKRRLTSEIIHFSGEKVRDLSATEHVVTGTARAAGLPPKSYTCTVSHAGNSWVLGGLAGV
ncbi:MAG TPA: hypothetical protein VE198_04665 [Actinoallomurus sp.]|nr:hypothetical protein [Actinoallomurus sp.]